MKTHLIYVVRSHQVEVLINLVPHAQSVAEALPQDAYIQSLYLLLSQQTKICIHALL